MITTIISWVLYKQGATTQPIETHLSLIYRFDSCAHCAQSTYGHCRDHSVQSKYAFRHYNTDQWFYNASKWWFINWKIVVGILKWRKYSRFSLNLITRRGFSSTVDQNPSRSGIFGLYSGTVCGLPTSRLDKNPRSCFVLWWFFLNLECYRNWQWIFNYKKKSFIIGFARKKNWLTLTFL